MPTRKTPFSKRCEILGELWLQYREEVKKDSTWTEFFDTYDIALPLSYMLWQDITRLNNNEAGPQYIDECWDVFCTMIGIDNEKLYNHLGECFDESPFPPVS